MRRFHPLDVLLVGVVLAMVLYAVAFAGLVSGRLGTDPAFGMSALALVFGAACLGGFMWAQLFDVLRRPFPAESTRLLYLVLILLVVPVGAIVYYVTVARRDRQGVLRS